VLGLRAGSSARPDVAVAETIGSDSSVTAGRVEWAESKEFEVVVGAEVSCEIEGFRMVEVAGRSDAGRVYRCWEASSARTKMAEVPLKLAQRTSANQARWRDLLMRSFKLRSDKRQYLLNGPTVWVVDRGSNKGLCSSTVGQYTPRKDDVPFEARLFR